MSERPLWRAVGSKLKKKLKTEPSEPIDQAIRDSDAQVAARNRERAADDEIQRQISAQQQEEQRIMSQEQTQRRLALLRESQAQLALQAETERRELQKKQNAGSANIAHLRALLRERYRLDVGIWNQRKVTRVQKANRRIIMEDCKKADSIMQQIYEIISGWEEELFEDPEEWRIADTIKRALLRKDQHMVWTDTPPWECTEDGGTIARKPVPRMSGGHRPAELDT